MCKGWYCWGGWCEDNLCTCSRLFCIKPCGATHSQAVLWTRNAVVTFSWTGNNTSEKLTVELYEWAFSWHCCWVEYPHSMLVGSFVWEVEVLSSNFTCVTLPWIQATSNRSSILCVIWGENRAALSSEPFLSSLCSFSVVWACSYTSGPTHQNSWWGQLVRGHCSKQPQLCASAWDMEVLIGIRAHLAESHLSTSFEMSTSRIRPQRLAERRFAREYGECKSQSCRSRFCIVLYCDFKSQQQGIAALKGHLNAISGQISCLIVVEPVDVRDHMMEPLNVRLAIQHTLDCIRLLKSNPLCLLIFKINVFSFSSSFMIGTTLQASK